MRIISGKYRGKKLFSPSDDRVRPTTDRIKETIFNMLQFRLADAAVLDLFGGSGALAVECISRGASSAEVVDNSIDSIALIRRNLEGIEGDISIVSSDAFSYLERTNKKFDLIFLDPPYNKGLGNKALEIIFRRGILDHGGTVIFEHETGEEIEFYSTLSEGYFLDVKKKKMGSTTVDFIRRGSVAIVAGSFDPFTVGHRALVDYATERYTMLLSRAWSMMKRIICSTMTHALQL
jgi:16S rRNA (guanine(966)-N(2))-methyltransferase RsmD